MRRAVHALYECCYSVPLAADLARRRPYSDHDSLFRQADQLLFALGGAVHRLDPAGVSRRRPSAGQREVAAEQCAIWDERAEVMDQLAAASEAYLDQFGFGFVMFVNGYCAQDVLAAVTDRMHNDVETERKVVRNELARINRTRLERMLGPEGGYDNW